MNHIFLLFCNLLQKVSDCELSLIEQICKWITFFCCFVIYCKNTLWLWIKAERVRGIMFEGTLCAQYFYDMVMIHLHVRHSHMTTTHTMSFQGNRKTLVSPLNIWSCHRGFKLLHSHLILFWSDTSHLIASENSA